MARAPDGRTELCLTVNLHGTTVELREADPGSLYGRKSYGRYAGNVGHRRLLDLFDRLGLRATFFVPGREAELAPGFIERLLSAGHEVAAHGYAMEDHSALGGRQAELLARTHEILTKLAGAAPRGWRAPEGRLSAETLPLLARLGYAYDSSFQDDDVPYPLRGDGGGGMLELPQNQILIDATLYRACQTHDRVLRHWGEELDAAAREGCFLCLTLHGRGDYGSGRAARVAVVEAFLRSVIARGIAIRRCADVVEAWHRCRAGA